MVYQFRMIPDDLEQLRRLYSFHPDNLKGQFFSRAKEIHKSNAFLVKQYALFRFRELCPQAPPGLMRFHISTLTGHQLGACKLPSLATIPRDPDLTTRLLAISRESPWVVDYFVISTFPAIFDGFTCEDFNDLATDFLINHIDDPLTPRLVGSYLLHFFVFRERLMERFLVSLNPAISSSPLLRAASPIFRSNRSRPSSPFESAAVRKRRPL